MKHFTYLAIERETDRQTGRQTDRQTDKQTDRQTDRQTERDVGEGLSFIGVDFSFEFEVVEVRERSKRIQKWLEIKDVHEKL